MEEQNSYLRQQARQDADKHLSRTFVLTETLADDENATNICGYYTLAAASLDFDNLPAEKRLSRYPAPVALLAHLAIDRRFQGQGLGELLLFDAIGRCALVAQHIGQYALVLDAREEELVTFYERYGFRRAVSEDHPRRLYLKMTEIRAMGMRPLSLTV